MNENSNSNEVIAHNKMSSKSKIIVLLIIIALLVIAMFTHNPPIL